MSDDALFVDPDSALRFAFDARHFCATGATPMAKAALAELGQHSMRGMSAADWIAQAGIIRQRLSGLVTPEGWAFLLALYGRGREREVALACLSKEPAVAVCHPNRDALVSTLRNYCARPGERRPLREVAADVGMHHSSVLRLERRLDAAIRLEFAGTVATVIGYLSGTGMVRKTDTLDGSRT